MVNKNKAFIYLLAFGIISLFILQFVSAWVEPEFQYDSFDRVTRVSYPDGTTYSYSYTPDGKLSFASRNGIKTTFVYDSQDRVIFEKTTGAGVLEYSWYDFYLASIKGPGFKTEFTYDESSIISEKTTSTKTNEEFISDYGYDEEGMLVNFTDALGSVVSYDYDEDYLLNSKGFSGLAVSYTPQLSTETLESTQICGDVCVFDNQIYTSDGLLIEDGYNLYDYDENYDLISVSISNNVIVSLEYYDDGLPQKSYFADGEYETYTYDAFGELVGIDGHYIDAFGNAYDSSITAAVVKNFFINLVRTITGFVVGDDSCTSEIKQCSDGTWVSRNSSNSCNFDSCPKAPVGSFCTDFDSGDLFTQGELDSDNLIGGLDYCSANSGEESFMFERVCENDAAQVIRYDCNELFCSDGECNAYCDNGACFVEFPVVEPVYVDMKYTLVNGMRYTPEELETFFLENRDSIYQVCVDNDGFDLYNGSYVLFDYEPYYDTCKDENTLKEYGCGFGFGTLIRSKPSYKERTCEFGCFINRCLNESEVTNSLINETSCFSDVECNPNEFCEFDFCSAETGKCTLVPENTTSISSPVCGCNNITYNNDYGRQMARVSKLKDGVCINNDLDLPPEPERPQNFYFEEEV